MQKCLLMRNFSGSSNSSFSQKISFDNSAVRLAKNTFQTILNLKNCLESNFLIVDSYSPIFDLTIVFNSSSISGFNKLYLPECHTFQTILFDRSKTSTIGIQTIPRFSIMKLFPALLITLISNYFPTLDFSSSSLIGKILVAPSKIT